MRRVTMNIYFVIFMFILGIVLIVKGGDYFVDAASWIAEASGVPKLIIGATIVSIATTLPEMLVSVQSALEGKVDMSIGNAVGSVTANIGLIMAISIIFLGSSIKRKDYIAKTIMMILATLLVCISGFTGSVNIIISIVLLLIFLYFEYTNIKAARVAMNNSNEDEEKVSKDKKTVITNIVKFIGGAVGIVLGADFLVDYGSELARFIGISERVIGVTMIAIGTSLPELVTTITAITKKESSLSVGNILGANIMDLTLILPLSSIISGEALSIASNSALIDFPACLLVGLVATIPAMIKEKFMKWQGILLLVIYITYVIITCSI